MANEKQLIDANLTDVEVFQREKECVKRKSATNCTDCLNCDLLMTDDRILSAYDNAIKALQKTEDAVEVIRCKDCKQWVGVTFGNVCMRFSSPFSGIKNFTMPDDFCSYGQRRGEE